MTARSRSSDPRRRISGTYWRKTGNVTVTGVGYWGTREECDDVIGEWDSDNPFVHKEFTTLFPVLNGTYVIGGVANRRFTNYPIGYKPDPPSPYQDFLPPTSLELQNLGVTVAARTNPSKPDVDLPTFIAELKDLPDLFRLFRKPVPGTRIPFEIRNLPSLVMAWGNAILRKIAEGNLTWRFALNPMISDVLKMFQFTEKAYQRFLYLDRLKRGQSVRRNMLLGMDVKTTTATSSTTVHSEGAVITAKRHVRTQYNHWASMRWKSASTFSVPRDVLSRYELADRLTWGITGYNALRTFWELTPWSWLIDWFWRVGDFIDACDNTVPVIPTGFCYMRTSSSETWYTDWSKPDWVTISNPAELDAPDVQAANNPWGSFGYLERRIDKTREIPSSPILAPPLPSLPALTSGQWSILGSLAALRGVPRGMPRRIGG